MRIASLPRDWPTAHEDDALDLKVGQKLADYPALSVDRAGGGNPLYAEDTPNQEFLNWCVTNQDQSL